MKPSVAARDKQETLTFVDLTDPEEEVLTFADLPGLTEETLTFADLTDPEEALGFADLPGLTDIEEDALTLADLEETPELEEDTKAIEEFLTGPARLTDRKSDAERAADVINEPYVSTERRAKRIVQDATLGQEVTSGVYSYLRSWVQTNWRTVLWSVGFATALGVTVAVGTIFLGAGSWLLFLQSLSYLGVTVVPSALISALQAAGVGIAANASVGAVLYAAKKNKRIKKILEKKVPASYLKPILKRMGVDPNTVTTEAAIRQAVLQGSFLGTGMLAQGAYGGLYTFTTSSGISMAAGYAREAAGMTVSAARSAAVSTATAIVETGDAVRRATADAILNGPEEENVGDAIAREIVNTEPTEVRKKRPPTVSRPRRITQEASSTTNTISNGKMLGFATTVGISTVALAVAAGNTEVLTKAITSQISSLGPTALAKLGGLGAVLAEVPGGTLIAESSFAQTLIVKYLLDKIGVSRLIDAFADKLTPSQKERILSYSDAIKREKDENKAQKLLRRIFGILSGGKHYTAAEYKRMTTGRLQKLYTQKVGKGATKLNKARLIDALIRDQEERTAMLTQVFSGTVKQTLQMTVASAALRVTYDGYKYAQSSLGELEVERGRLEGLREREASIEEARRFKEQQKIERRAEAAKLKEEIKARKIKTLEERELKRAILEEKAEKRRLEKLLRDAARAEQIARNNDITIVRPDGTSHPMPVEDEILNPQLQEALDWEFTPLGQKVAKEVGKSLFSSIPGVGWVEGAIQQANNVLDAVETITKVGKVVEVGVRLQQGETDIDVTDWDVFDRLTQQRIPSLGTIVDDIVRTDTVNAKIMVLDVLKDKIIEGWDNKRVALEIGRRVLGSPEGLSIDLTESIGGRFWKTAFE